MKLIGILLICCLVQALNGEAAFDTLKSGSPRTKGLRTVISGLLSSKKLPNRAASLRITGKTLTTISNAASALDLTSITASLQEVFINLESVNLSSLSNNVNSAFKSITTTCHKVSSKASGIIGSVDVALSGINAALSNLIDTILASMSATVRELSHAIDNAIDKIIKTLDVLNRAIKGIIKSIATVTSIVYSTLQAILKTTVMIAAKSLNTVRTSLVESDLFVTPLLSTVLKKLSDEVADVDVTTPIDIEKIIAELSKCSEGTEIELECYSSTMDGSSNEVNIEINAISTCPPCTGEWIAPLDGLKSTISRSFDEILYSLESGTKALPDWIDTITPAMINNVCAILDLIDAALLASDGKSKKLEPAIVQIALGVQSILIALDSITTRAKTDHSELVSNALKLIEHACYTVISMEYDVFFGISVPIDGSIMSTSILPALTTTLEVGIEGSPSELLDIHAAIDYICIK